MFEATPGLGSFDSVLAGVAMSVDATYLLSADAAFSRVEGISFLDLGADDLEERLGIGSGDPG